MYVEKGRLLEWLRLLLSDILPLGQTERRMDKQRSGKRECPILVTDMDRVQEHITCRAPHLHSTSNCITPDDCFHHAAISGDLLPSRCHYFYSPWSIDRGTYGSLPDQDGTWSSAISPHNASIMGLSWLWGKRQRKGLSNLHLEDEDSRSIKSCSPFHCSWILQAFLTLLAIMHLTAALFALHIVAGSTQNVPPPPSSEPIEVVELRLPPIAPSDEVGSCTLDVNPRGTGCIRREMGDHEFQAGDFTPDGNHVIVNVAFVGAPAAPDPASIYTGEQVILVKADGTNFTNGDHWKCLSCAVPPENARSLDEQKDYPHVFRGGDKALWGHK